LDEKGTIVNKKYEINNSFNEVVTFNDLANTACCKGDGLWNRHYCANKPLI
jgi:hypothetical protein